MTSLLVEVLLYIESSPEYHFATSIQNFVKIP